MATKRVAKKVRRSTTKGKIAPKVKPAGNENDPEQGAGSKVRDVLFKLVKNADKKIIKKLLDGKSSKTKFLLNGKEDFSAFLTACKTKELTKDDYKEYHDRVTDEDKAAINALLLKDLDDEKEKTSSKTKSSSPADVEVELFARDTNAKLIKVCDGKLAGEILIISGTDAPKFVNGVGKKIPNRCPLVALTKKGNSKIYGYCIGTANGDVHLHDSSDPQQKARIALEAKHYTDIASGPGGQMKVTFYKDFHVSKSEAVEDKKETESVIVNESLMDLCRDALKLHDEKGVDSAPSEDIDELEEEARMREEVKSYVEAAIKGRLKPDNNLPLVVRVTTKMVFEVVIDTCLTTGIDQTNDKRSYDAKRHDEKVLKDELTIFVAYVPGMKYGGNNGEKFTYYLPITENLALLKIALIRLSNRHEKEGTIKYMAEDIVGMYPDGGKALREEAGNIAARVYQAAEMGLLDEQEFTAENAKQYLDCVSSYEAPNMVLTHTTVFMEFQKVILGLSMAVRKAINRLEPHRNKFVTAQELQDYWVNDYIIDSTIVNFLVGNLKPIKDFLTPKVALKISELTDKSKVVHPVAARAARFLGKQVLPGGIIEGLNSKEKETKVEVKEVKEDAAEKGTVAERGPKEKGAPYHRGSKGGKHRREQQGGGGSRGGGSRGGARGFGGKGGRDFGGGRGGGYGRSFNDRGRGRGRGNQRWSRDQDDDHRPKEEERRPLKYDKYKNYEKHHDAVRREREEEGDKKETRE